MLSEEQKQKILSPLSSSKSLLLRTSSCLSEELIDWQQTIINKSIGKNKAFVSKTCVYITFEGTCPKKHSKSPTSHFLLQLKQLWVKSKLCSFCKPLTWWKTFDKSSVFNKQATYKMKKICSNQVLERTFSGNNRLSGLQKYQQNTDKIPKKTDYR